MARFYVVQVKTGEPLAKAEGVSVAPYDATWALGDTALRWREVEVGGGVVQVRAPWMNNVFRFYAGSFELAKALAVDVVKALRAGKVPATMGQFASDALFAGVA